MPKEKEYGTKMLTDKELIDIVRRAPEEIDDGDAYTHFLEDLAGLVTSHFGGEVEYVSPPQGPTGQGVIHRCDNCSCAYEDGEFIPLEECKALGQRLTQGGKVPSGDCPKCGAFVDAEHKNVDDDWIAVISHNECIPDDGWVYKKYDPDIDWSEESPILAP